MMKQKRRRMIAALLVMCCIPTMTALAGTTWWGYTEYTYVSTYHSDFYLSDTYTGTVSVRGADWIGELPNFHWPMYSRIKYDVQGNIFTTEVNSKNERDEVQRMDTITVKDIWNFGSATTCTYKIGISLRDPKVQPYKEESSGE